MRVWGGLRWEILAETGSCRAGSEPGQLWEEGALAWGSRVSGPVRGGHCPLGPLGCSLALTGLSFPGCKMQNWAYLKYRCQL